MNDSVEKDGASGQFEDHAERGNKPQSVTVHVLHVNETERATFKMKATSTLRDTWSQAYVELNVDRRDKDTFQTSGRSPVSLMEYLDLTLQDARERNLLENFKFSIVCETGGA